MLSLRPNRGGFTLVELMVVTVIVSLMALIVAPRVLAIRESGDARRAESNLLASIGRAREIARSRGESVVVGLEPQSGLVNISGADEKEDRYTTDLALNASMKIDSIGATDTKDELPKPEKGEALTQFNDDGSATPASAEITLAGRKMTVRVRGDGAVVLGGEEETNDRWEAGDLEQRT